MNHTPPTYKHPHTTHIQYAYARKKKQTQKQFIHTRQHVPTSKSSELTPPNSWVRSLEICSSEGGEGTVFRKVRMYFRKRRSFALSYFARKTLVHSHQLYEEYVQDERAHAERPTEGKAYTHTHTHTHTTLSFLIPTGNYTNHT
jgi:hypothetical protein